MSAPSTLGELIFGGIHFVLSTKTCFQVSQIRRGECSQFLLVERESILAGTSLQLPERRTLGTLLGRLSWSTVAFQLLFTTLVCSVNYTLLKWMHSMKEEEKEESVKLNSI